MVVDVREGMRDRDPQELLEPPTKTTLWTLALSMKSWRIFGQPLKTSMDEGSVEVDDFWRERTEDEHR